jgi:DsbE subfamily thiol:disulfide oxidoreductase
MKRALIPLAIFLIVVGFLFKGLFLNPREVPSPLVGKPAPQFSLPRLDNPETTFSPKEMLGKVWLFNVWASWCSPCRAEEPTLAALSRTFSDVQFIGILTRDNPVNAEAFTRKRGTPYPTLIDDSILIGFSKSLPANAIPTTVIIDRNGKVASRVSGVVTVASLTALIEEVRAE